MSRLQDIDRVIERAIPAGMGQVASSGLTLYASATPTRRLSAAYRPMACFVVSGAKRTFLGRETFAYGAGEYLLVSADLPVNGQVMDAPYRAVSFDLDPVAVSRLLVETGDDRPCDTARPNGLIVAQADEDLLDCLYRLVRLTTEPGNAAVLGPGLERELLWRLLSGPHASTLKAIASPDSRLAGVNRAIQWLSEKYADRVRVQDLADVAGMSASSFHRHFKSVTRMSPLQFQKVTRLQEARARLLGIGGGIAETGFAVGYDSPSQFSRDYARWFGSPPGRDAMRMRADTDASLTA